MKNQIAGLLLLVTTLFIYIGCANSSEKNLPFSVDDAIASERSTLNQELTNTLSYMGNEERLAYDVYNKLYEKYGTRQFTNIANNSEYKHIKAVQGLVKKYFSNSQPNFTNVDAPPLNYKNTAIEDMEAGVYDIADIQYLYDLLISKGSASEIDALKVGCIVEVTDINDLDNFIKVAENINASDIVAVFNFLRNGSYHHYWAFDRGLKDKGVPNGCCSLGVVDDVNYCHPEYPNSSNENKNSHKEGRRGNRRGN
ncbi:MAG: DUF2202 domain-containing protein [Sulfurovum sp.]|nr:DUF2202 domain-containing protein [Sulfurovum sp.]MCB4754080.1 DUF2202 domain-containing protein [Sulfurovum sp.]